MEVLTMTHPDKQAAPMNKEKFLELLAWIQNQAEWPSPKILFQVYLAMTETNKTPDDILSECACTSPRPNCPCAVRAKRKATLEAIISAQAAELERVKMLAQEITMIEILNTYGNYEISPENFRKLAALKKAE